MFYPSGVAAKKGIIISVSLNEAMAVMSNQLKIRLESSVTTPRPPPGENRPEASSVKKTPKYSCLYLTPFYKYSHLMFKVPYSSNLIIPPDY